MGDLIGNAKEFAKEMEQYLQLQRAADKAKRDADAIKKDHPYGKTGSADELADLGLCYREPSHKLAIRPKKSK